MGVLPRLVLPGTSQRLLLTGHVGIQRGLMGIYHMDGDTVNGAPKYVKHSSNSGDGTREGKGGGDKHTMYRCGKTGTLACVCRVYAHIQAHIHKHTLNITQTLNPIVGRWRVTDDETQIAVNGAVLITRGTHTHPHPCLNQMHLLNPHNSAYPQSLRIFPVSVWTGRSRTRIIVSKWTIPSGARMQQVLPRTSRVT